MWVCILMLLHADFYVGVYSHVIARGYTLDYLTVLAPDVSASML